jgi:PAS domain S-box-containing protein
LPNSQPAKNPFKRLFKPDPYRELFRILADSLDRAILVIARDGQQILACNHTFLTLTGYSRTELEHLVPQALFAESATDSPLTQVLETGQAPESPLDNVPLMSRDGSVTQVDLQIRSVGPGPSAILLSMHRSSARHRLREQRDVTHQRLRSLARLTQVLLEGETSAIASFLEAAQSLLGTSHTGLYRVSPSGPDYVLEGSLPEQFPDRLPASEMRPIPRTEQWARGKRASHPLHKAAKASGFQALHTIAIGTSKAWIGILVAAWQDQGLIPVEIDALMTVVANLGHATLQIGLQQAAIADLGNALVSLEQELADQASAVSEALLSLDGDLRVMRANLAAARMLGYKPGELDGLPIQDVLVGPEDVLATLLDAQGHQREAERQHFTIHRRDGIPFPVHLRAVPLTRGRSSRLLVALSDQSERKAIEDHTETLAQRALLGEVTAIFAHEVRNPINNISTGVQLVASRLGKGHRLHDALDRIRKECTRLDQLMTDVLFFARPLELKIEPLDLADLLDRILARWEPRLQQAEIKCLTSHAPQTPPALADPRTFEQVIVNLITNSLEAMPEGGSISFSLSPADAAQGTMVELKIADTGPGIPADVLERIFDPFFTTKKEGTGLGLAITRRILTAHKGAIQAESFPDAGTVFTIRVPSHQSGQEDASK